MARLGTFHEGEKNVHGLVTAVLGLPTSATSMHTICSCSPGLSMDIMRSFADSLLHVTSASSVQGPIQ